MLAGTRRSTRTDPRDMDLLDGVEGGRRMAGQQAGEPWREAGPYHDVTRALTGLRIELQ